MCTISMKTNSASLLDPFCTAIFPNARQDYTMILCKETFLITSNSVVISVFETNNPPQEYFTKLNSTHEKIQIIKNSEIELKRKFACRND